MQPNLYRLETTDPDEFVDAVSSVATEISISPLKKGIIRAGVRASRLPSLGLMMVKGKNLRVLSEMRSYTGVTIPLIASFEISHRRKESCFLAGDAHILNSNHAFDFRISEACAVLVVNIDDSELNTVASKLAGGRETHLTEFADRLSLTTPDGVKFWRSASELWQRISRPPMLSSPLPFNELEQSLISRLLIATDDKVMDQYENGYHLPRLKRTEEYVLANLTDPISLTDLCHIAGLNVRTLSRAFQKRHGISPMKFVRERRLDAMRQALLAADSDQTTVTQVALNYGFHHIGRFAFEYRRTFDEYPSDTLRT